MNVENIWCYNEFEKKDFYRQFDHVHFNEPNVC